MTRKIPFTAASLARAIKGVELAGRFVVGVKPDGTLIVGDKPLETASLLSADSHDAADSKWADQPVRRFGDKLFNRDAAGSRSRK